MNSILEKLRRELEASVAGMTEEEMLRHPEGKWCAAEVLEHLYLSYTGTAKGFENVLEAGKSLATATTLKNRMQTFFVLTFDYLPEGRKAPKHTLPRGIEGFKITALAVEQIAALDAVMERCEARMGGGKVLNHPFLGPFTVGQWRKFHLLHGRHHLKQIGRLRNWGTARLGN